MLNSIRSFTEALAPRDTPLSASERTRRGRILTLFLQSQPIINFMNDAPAECRQPFLPIRQLNVNPQDISQFLQASTRQWIRQVESRPETTFPRGLGAVLWPIAADTFSNYNNPIVAQTLSQHYFPGNGVNVANLRAFLSFTREGSNTNYMNAQISKLVLETIASNPQHLQAILRHGNANEKNEFIRGLFLTYGGLFNYEDTNISPDARQRLEAFFRNKSMLFDDDFKDCRKLF